jgi:TetR/AcrR family transcriptional repressor of nem operon
MGRNSAAQSSLVVSATELLYTQGYRGAGVDTICDHAGVHKGSFYYFFPSKQALALASIDFSWHLIEAAVLVPAFGHDLPPLARIRRFFDLLVQASAAEHEQQGTIGGCRFGNLAAEMAPHAPEIRTAVHGVLQSIATYVEAALTDAVAAGEVSGIDPAANAQALVAYMEGILLLGRTTNDPDLMRRLAAQAMALAVAPTA